MENWIYQSFIVIDGNPIVISNGMNKVYKWNEYNIGVDLAKPKERKNMRKKDMIKMIKQLDEKVYKMDNVINRLDKRIDNLNSNNTKQLQCGVKGHEFVFEKEMTYTNGNHVWVRVDNFQIVASEEFQFKCSNCGLIITKTEAELTVKEKNALKTLGILKG